VGLDSDLDRPHLFLKKQSHAEWRSSGDFGLFSDHLRAEISQFHFLDYKISTVTLDKEAKLVNMVLPFISFM